ncbi:MAG: Flp pilus assembly complex ATPase component TadA [Armatimonadetes bacterium]|nr:Flp pilus assembly complex ATPase component TadA [Armatimonadota bacterium]
MSISPELARLFDAAVAASASDIHLVAGEPPRYRVDGNLPATPNALAVSPGDLEEWIMPLFPASTQTALQSGTVSLAETLVVHGSFNFVIVLYRSAGSFVATVRFMPAHIPTLQEVNGAFLADFAEEPHGLILMTGLVGSGKTTTAFALLQECVACKPCRIYLVEESPAYRLQSETALISPLIIGQDVPDYTAALRLLLRGADADVVFLADLPTAETAVAALELAQLGTLVIASVAAPSAASALATLSSGLPEPMQSVLTEQLIAVTNQRLVKKADGSGRIAEYETLRGADAANDLTARLYTTTFPATP